MSEWYYNTTATVKRLNASTGAFASVGTVEGMIQPVIFRPWSTVAPYVAEDYRGEITDEFMCDVSSDIQQDDQLMIDGEQYRAHRPRKQRGGEVEHMIVPLAAYKV